MSRGRRKGYLPKDARLSARSKELVQQVSEAARAIDEELHRRAREEEAAIPETFTEPTVTQTPWEGNAIARWETLGVLTLAEIGTMRTELRRLKVRIKHLEWCVEQPDAAPSYGEELVAAREHQMKLRMVWLKAVERGEALIEKIGKAKGEVAQEIQQQGQRTVLYLPAYGTEGIPLTSEAWERQIQEFEAAREKAALPPVVDTTGELK